MSHLLGKVIWLWVKKTGTLHFTIVVGGPITKFTEVKTP